MSRRKNKKLRAKSVATSPVVAPALTATTVPTESNVPNTEKEPLTTTMRQVELGQLYFNGLLVIAAFLAIVVSSCQYLAMRSQNEEMLKQTKSTQDQLAAMKDQNKIAEATLKQMQTDQRAWVIPEVPAFDGDPTPEEVRFKIRMKNYGTKPAVFSQYSSAWEPFFWGPNGIGLGSTTTYEQIYRRLTENEGLLVQTAIIAPGEVHEFVGYVVGPGEEGFKKIFSTSDKHKPAMFCRIVYYDVNGERYETIRSFFYEHDTKSLKPCPVFNNLK